MEKVIIVRYGEVSLKGINRPYFEDTLIKNLKRALRKYEGLTIFKKDSRIYIENLGSADPIQIAAEASKVFGVVSVSVASKLDSDLEQIKAAALEMVSQKLAAGYFPSFKVETKRADKSFHLQSQEISKMVGGFILKHSAGLKVDVHRPALTVYVEIRDYAYLYTDKIPGFGGMPYATNGKALLLLSGGIDSPVAGWLMAKRGVEVEAVHFHSYPFTSERAKEKVISLARIIAEYCRVIKLHIVNLLEIQQAIRANCPEEYFTIISRRYMMFIAEKIAVQNECSGLITGESLGQVASQTIQSLAVTNAAVDLPIFRPLIGMDKSEITGLAQKIGTYETSILPYEDCCTVFLPKRPALKPRLEKILKAETGLDRETLIKNALDKMEVFSIKPY
ncbi:MAG: tRNA 4-thiouridine(8) synthase ThiI [Firmicutes bacterium]|nr:tRNA 4-thiouridine(8) synthase ThiI [Bacillota bacterium]